MKALIRKTIGPEPVFGHLLTTFDIIFNRVIDGNVPTVFGDTMSMDQIMSNSTTELKKKLKDYELVNIEITIKQ